MADRVHGHAPRSAPSARAREGREALRGDDEPYATTDTPRWLNRTAMILFLIAAAVVLLMIALQS